jgi:hypothetical protein
MTDVFEIKWNDKIYKTKNLSEYMVQIRKDKEKIIKEIFALKFDEFQKDLMSKAASQLGIPAEYVSGKEE